MAMAKGGLFLSGVSLTKLEAVYFEEKNVKAKIRLQCALLRKKGKLLADISEVTGLSITTISDILIRFGKRGLRGCYAIKQKGQPKKLSNVQRLKLKKFVSRQPIKLGLPFVVWTTKLVAYIVYKLFKISYTLRQITNILKSMNLSLQKARPEHINANKKLQAEFKKNFTEELKSLENVDMRSYFWTNALLNSSHTSSEDGLRRAHIQQ